MTYLSGCGSLRYKMRNEDIDMTEKEFMETLWDSNGETINTPLGVGVIEEVRTMAGVDFSVRVKIPNIDGSTLFSGLTLFEFNA